MRSLVGKGRHATVFFWFSDGKHQPHFIEANDGFPGFIIFGATTLNVWVMGDGKDIEIVRMDIKQCRLCGRVKSYSAKMMEAEWWGRCWKRVVTSLGVVGACYHGGSYFYTDEKSV